MDATSGNSVASYSYDPWGKVLSATEDPAVTGQPIRYASYFYDTETQLYYLRGIMIRRRRGLSRAILMEEIKTILLARISMLMLMMIR